jgi:CO/xanthine dehydrogenase FAD-binding subunit
MISPCTFSPEKYIGADMYLRPSTIEDAVAALSRAPSRVLAGGTDVMPTLVDRVQDLPFVDIGRVEGLSGISREDDVIRIGARTTWTDVIRADLPPAFAALAQAAREVGSVQIQNVATIAGNLCNASPAADGVPPLLILDASVELASVRGRRVVPLRDFIRGNRVTDRRPDELLSAILVPRSFQSARSAFLKLGSRRYLVISIAMAAAAVVVGEDGLISEARLAVGACSTVAQRLDALEQDLAGVPAARALEVVASRHVESLTPIDDVRATAAYRRDAALTLVRRVLGSCLPETARA